MATALWGQRGGKNELGERDYCSSSEEAKREASNRNLEVFVMLTPFEAFGERILKYVGPSVGTTFRDVMKCVGICHYMIAFREVGNNGNYRAFDFGPIGGADRDVVVSHKEEGVVPVDNGQGNKSKAVQGKVKEALIYELPKDHLQVGTTTMTLDEVRDLCNSFPEVYELHANDCRHFVNAVAEVATGVKRASLVVGRDSMKRQSLLKFWSPWEVGMLITDYQNFPWVTRYSKTFTTVMAAVSGSKLGWHLIKPNGGFFNFNLGILERLQNAAVPQLVRSGGKLVVDKPIRGSAITATYATALATFNESSLFREGVRLTKDLGDGIKAFAGMLEGAIVAPIVEVGPISSSALNALGGIGVTLRRRTANTIRPLAQVRCPSLAQVLQFAPRRRTASIAAGTVDHQPFSLQVPEGVTKMFSKVLPTLKMNKALQGRAMRLARPAYELTVGANANM
ncbi:hypothetical protein HOP50_03g19860 [Chloropicon primus]|uniref:Uncharacterized protein n=2 Tax=Chloropicon primus TaxID=1764295 RepID=A0A5B8MJ97_9CHLO|nr:hypothetical protein A3770_03p19880 [Chloropicon primus]UPQ98680.1 hypothetical protein HOP50_03g19860 [Chloropicon primus]|eukprot:QDZ19470.1 hypothetical protein A3770_03p19880 [Chloropicon primus]